MRRRFPLVLLVSCALTLVAAPVAVADAGPPTIAAADLRNAGRACWTAADRPVSTGYFGNELDAVARVDGAVPSGTYRFVVWAVGDRAHPTSLTVPTDADRSADVIVPDGVLVDGTRYAWRVRYTGAAGRSAWSPTCLFRYDTTSPATPVITPTNFVDPQTAPAGRFADFHLDSNGSADVIGYEYAWNDVLSVPVCSLSGPQGQLVCPDPSAGDDLLRTTAADGSADVSLSPPWWGSNRLMVRSVDAAGNRSSETSYEFSVSGSGPTITPVSAGAVCGPLVRVRFAPDPHVSGVVAYTYSVAHGPVRTVRANRSGRAAVTLPLPRSGTTLEVRSRSVDGFDSTGSDDYLRPDPQPFVFGDVYTADGGPAGGVGVPGTFAIHPPPGFDPAVDTLAYRFSDGTSGTVPADTGRITWTPASAGRTDLAVSALDASGGVISCGTTYSFVVAG